jgi:predicted ester cyclase
MSARDTLIALAAAASRGDLDAIRDLSGHDRVVESFRRLLTAFPDATVAPEWVIEERDRAAGFAAIRGTHLGEWRGIPPTGRSIDVHGMIAVQVTADGHVADFWVANDWLGIAMQLGVPLALPDA